MHPIFHYLPEDTDWWSRFLWDCCLQYFHNLFEYKLKAKWGGKGIHTTIFIYLRSGDLKYEDKMNWWGTKESLNFSKELAWATGTFFLMFNCNLNTGAVVILSYPRLPHIFGCILKYLPIFNRSNFDGRPLTWNIISVDADCPDEHFQHFLFTKEDPRAFYNMSSISTETIITYLYSPMWSGWAGR